MRPSRIQACENMDALIAEARPGLQYSVDVDADESWDGRYFAFLVKDVRVWMPGLPIAEDWPRIFLGGGSWTWKYAVKILKELVR